MEKKISENTIIPAERQETIRKIILANGSASINEIAEYYDVSIATIRRDFDEICKSSQFTRTHGGATAYLNNTNFDRTFDDKLESRYSEKLRIGKRAAEMVSDGDTVIVDSGSTGYIFAQCLREKKQITLITNDLHIALNVTLDFTSTMIVLPGQRIDKTKVVVGKDAENLLKNVKANKLFLCADAISIEGGITNVNLIEMGIKQAMIEAAQKIVLLADSSKFEKTTLMKVMSDFSKVDKIITDTALPLGVYKKYLPCVDIEMV